MKPEKTWDEAMESVYKIMLEEWSKEEIIEFVKERVNNEWIPCKERLPESNGKYMVTWVGVSGNIYVDILSYGYADDAETNPCWYNYDSEYGECIHHDVTAWMPLPMPYKESEHNEVYETIKRGLEDAVNGRVTEYAPIVRCKDCLWRGDDEYCDKHGFQNATDEFFCASGRKEQEDG